MEEEKLWTILIILLLAFTVMGGTSGATAFAQSIPVIFIDPSTSTGTPSAGFTINITVTNITQDKSLYSWEVEIAFDSSVVTAVEAAEGPFLKNVSTTFWAPPKINNTAGTVNIGAMLFPFPPSGAVGSGTLASVTFHVEAQGATPLSFTKHELYTVIGTISSPIEHEAINGFFSNIHDIALINVTASSAEVVKPAPISINVTVVNEGDFLETFNVTTCYDNTAIRTWKDTTLEPRTSTTLTFTWNTTFVSVGSYTLRAETSIVPGETDTTDNVYLDGVVTIRAQLMAPAANFTYSPKKPVAGETVTFNASASTPDGGYIISYLWDFGDGTTEIYVKDANLTATATHGYTTGKTYKVRLTVENSEALKDSVETTIRVIDYPVAIFTCFPENPIIYENVTFNASESHDNRDGGWIVSYLWDFNYDGMTFEIEAAGKIVTHAFTVGRIYTVALRVTDNDGLADTATDYVTVLVHDIAITNVGVSASAVKTGGLISINVTFANEGNFSETFNVAVYYGNNVIETKSVTNLAPGVSKTLTIKWNTTNVVRGEYTIKAVASAVGGEKEIYTEDNTYTDGTVTITEGEKEPLEPVFIYAAAAAVVVIVSIAVYLFKIRKPKTT